MLVTLLVKFRNKDCKTTELGLLLQVLPVRIVTFVETLGSHLNATTMKVNMSVMQICTSKTMASVVTSKGQFDVVRRSWHVMF